MFRRALSILFLLILFAACWSTSAYALEVGTAEPFAWGQYDAGKAATARLGMGKMNEMGATWHREWISWKDWQMVRPTPGQSGLNESSARMLDAVQSAGREQGVETYAIIYNAPQWANGSGDGVYIPGNGDPSNPEFQLFAEDYGEFVFQLVQRYQGRIDAWEIWLEPDLMNYWKTDAPTTVEQRATGYAYLLKVAYSHAKEANPQATIVTGGLTAWYSDRFLTRLYQEGAGPYFDKANIHPWTENSAARPSESPLFAKIGTMRQIMDSHGDTGKQIWVTAFGWSTTGNDRNRTVTEEQRSQFMIDALETLDARYPSVEVFTFFRLMDRTWYESTDLEAGFGLLYTDYYADGVPTGHARYESKPSFDSLKAYLTGTMTNPRLELRTDNVYWADYAQYTSRILTVGTSLRNTGDGNARSLSITGSRSDSGVTIHQLLPVAIGDITIGSTSQFSLKYKVPAGVSRFKVFLEGRALNDRGLVVDFPAA